MPTPLPGRPDRGRAPDNEPPPLLTYGPDDYEGFTSRRRLPAWAWIAVLVLAAAGGAYYFLQARPDAWPAARTADAPFERLPVRATTTREAMLRALGATDTTVAPGMPVELSVRATGVGGATLSDVRVRFVVDRGGGTLSSEEAWTDPDGVARATLLTPNRASSVVVRASLEEPEAPATHFTVTTRTDAPATLTVVQGDGQEQVAGALLPQRLGVRVADAAGRPVPGVEVLFEVEAGGGLAAPSVTRTDTLGMASAIWRLGSEPGQQALAATSPGLAGSVSFTATARGSSTMLVMAAEPVVDDEPEAPAAVPPASVVVSSRDLAIGGSNICVISGSSVTCRGANDRGQGIAAGAPGATSVAAGLFHACALDASGTASCWGANDAGQLGDGTRSDRTTAARVATDLRFSVLAAGLTHTCGVTANGRAACWGQNLGGQLGDGSRDDRTTPGFVAGSVPFVDLTSGWNHTCGLTASRDLYCWGLNREGAVGDGSQLDGLSPQRIAGSVRSVAAGSAHTCAVSAGRVLCWGANGSGQLGDGTTTSRLSPTPVTGLPGEAVMLAAGAAHTCALLADGTAHCWGQNLHGQLGNSTTVGTSSPSQVVGGHSFTRLAAGGGVTCGVTEAGNAFCWGLNQSGQLGDGTFTNRTVPFRASGR